MLHIIFLTAVLGIIGLLMYFLSAGMLLGFIRFFEFCKKYQITAAVF
jgi:hypothetical protein